MSTLALPDPLERAARPDLVRVALAAREHLTALANLDTGTLDGQLRLVSSVRSLRTALDAAAPV